MSGFRVAMIQMFTDAERKVNLETASRYIRKAASEGADIAVLPEMFICPYQTQNFPVYAEPEGGESFQRLSEIAKENGIYLIAGSVPELEDGKVYNTCYAFDRNGKKIGKHRKVHLFDINVEGGQYFKESDTLTAGSQVDMIETEFGKIGLLICYDIRFPEMCRIMSEAGAMMVIVPGAFNMTTGPAHWEIHFRSRALDYQIYTVGVSPARDENGVYVSYGNSIAVSPWGDILERMDEKEGLRIVEIDPDRIGKVRNQLPLKKQARWDVYRKYPVGRE